jgi:hypothetical protein
MVPPANNLAADRFNARLPLRLSRCFTKRDSNRVFEMLGAALGVIGIVESPAWNSVRSLLRYSDNLPIKCRGSAAESNDTANSSELGKASGMEDGTKVSRDPSSIVVLCSISRAVHSAVPLATGASRSAFAASFATPSRRSRSLTIE